MSQRLAVILLGVVLIAPRATSAQARTPAEGGQPAPLYVASVDGSVDLVRNGIREAAVENMPVMAGDRLRADRGRVELRNDQGQAVYVDEASIVDISSETSIRLMAGSLRVIAAPRAREAFRIDAPNATVTLLSPGDYRVRVAAGLRTDETELRVRDGRAELATDRGAVEVGSGEVSIARGVDAPSRPMVAHAAPDDLDGWADTRAGAYGTTASSAYLPPQIASYGAVLDQYGTWAQEPEYGSVWYPSVAVDWRPYAYGTWGHAGFYGSVWIGQGPWAWPTHHYGRWGWNGGWFWVPGPVWAPAWVSWGVGDGYVGWCPLGWNDLPVFGFSVGVGYYGGGYGSHGYYGHGWTVVPSHYFRPGVPAWRHAVDHRGWGAHERNGFVTQRVPPAYRGGPVSGGHVEGGRWSSGGHYAVPRNGAPSTPGARQPGMAQRPTPGSPQGPTGPRGFGSSQPYASRQPYGSQQPSRVQPGGAQRYGSPSAPQPNGRWASPRTGVSAGTPYRSAPPPSTSAYRSYQRSVPQTQRDVPAAGSPRTSRSYGTSTGGSFEPAPGTSRSSRWMGNSPPTGRMPNHAAAPRRFEAPSYGARSAPSAPRSMPSFRSYGGGGMRGPSAAPPSASRGAPRSSGGGGRAAMPRGGPGRR